MKEETKERAREITQDILIGLATGAAIFLILSSPAGTRRFIRGIKWELKRRRMKKEYLMQKFYYLRRKKLIAFRQAGEYTEIVLTEEGKKKALRYQQSRFSLPHAEVWDGKFHLIFFDIPEEHRKARNSFGQKLKHLGCLRFNRSAWIYPYPCRDEIDFLAELYGVGRYIHYAVAQEITNREHLMLKFGLS